MDEDLHIPSNREEASSNRLELLEQAPLIVVTEYGSPIEPIQLLQLKWEDRLQVSLNFGISISEIVRFAVDMHQVICLCLIALFLMMLVFFVRKVADVCHAH